MPCTIVISHAHGLLLLAWVLHASLTVLECRDDLCRPPRGGASHVQHTAGTFATREACEQMRAQMAQTRLPVIRSSARPGITIKQDITYTCTQGDEDAQR